MIRGAINRKQKFFGMKSIFLLESGQITQDTFKTGATNRVAVVYN
jgi:hypothetical protein